MYKSFLLPEVFQLLQIILIIVYYYLKVGIPVISIPVISK
jgi:hypothetical protein